MFSINEAVDIYSGNKKSIIESDIIEDFFIEALELSSEMASNLIYEADNIDLSHGNAEDNFYTKIKLVKLRESLDTIVNNCENNCNQLLEDFRKWYLEYINIHSDVFENKEKIMKYKDGIDYSDPEDLGNWPMDLKLIPYRNLSSNTTYLNNLSKLLVTNFSRLTDFINLLKSEREEEVIRNSGNIVLDKDVNRMNSVRGFLLGKDRIEEKDYSSSLYSFFRGDKDHYGISDIYVDKVRVNLAKENTYDKNHTVDIIMRENTKFIDLIKDIVSHIESMSLDDKIKTQEGILLYNDIINGYCKELEEICSIYLLYIGAKADAMKDYITTNIIILDLINKKISSKRRK